MRYIRFPLLILAILVTLAPAYALTVNLAWDASPSPNVDGYRLHDGPASSTYATTTDVGNVLAAPLDVPIGPGETRYIAATAYGQCDDGQGGTVPCESGYSNEVIYTAQAGDTTPPTAPGTPSFSGTTSTQTTLAWTASTDNVGVTGYRVERCQGAGCSNFAEIAQPGTNSYTNTGLTASTSYSYRVRAADAAGNLGAYSSTASATTLASAAAPVATWAFDEGSGTTSVDATGNSHTMTLQGGTTWTTSGHTGNALSFSGSGQYATTPHVSNLTLGASGTLEAWVYLTALTRWHGVVSKGTANTDQSHNYAMEVTNANVPNCVLGTGSSNITITSATAIAINTWVHLACTWDGTTVRLYQNGTQTASGSQTLTPAGNTAVLSLGQFGASSDRMQGRIDDVRVWNVARSASEVASDMNTPVGAQAPAATVIGTITWTQP